MADPIYYTQIKQKIAQFEREKEQVQAHLALVERHCFTSSSLRRNEHQ